MTSFAIFDHKRHASSWFSQQAAVVDDHGALRAICAAFHLDALYLVHHVHPLRNSPERHVAVVCPPRIVLDGDEEPGARERFKKQGSNIVSGIVRT